MNNAPTIPSFRTILWASFAALIVVGATVAPAVVISDDWRVAVVGVVTGYCSTLAVMLGLGPKIPVPTSGEQDEGGV